MDTSYEIGSNGKPRVEFSKECKGVTQFNRTTGKIFKIGKETLFLTEYKINSPKEVIERSFRMSLKQDGINDNAGEYRIAQMKLNKEELTNIRDNINKILNETKVEKELLGCDKKYEINYFKGGSYKEPTAEGKYIETTAGTLINYDSPFTGRFFLKKDNGALEIIPMASIVEMREII